MTGLIAVPVLAQPVQIEFQKVKQIRPDTAKNDFKCSVSVNGSGITEHSWLALSDIYLKIVIQIQQTRYPKVFGMTTKYINIHKLNRSINEIVIPVKARTYEDPPGKYSYQWNCYFRISK